MAMTEVWCRNPKFYIEECLELGVENIAWDRGLLVKRRLDPVKFMDLYYGEMHPWRILVIGNQGATEYVSGTKGHVACYPTWSYGQDYSLLQELIDKPAGEYPDLYHTEWEEDDPTLRPVAGQEHRIVITDLPGVDTGVGDKLIRDLSDAQEANPHAIFHIHGLYSYRAMFGLSFRSVDIDPRSDAAHGRVRFPPGKPVSVEDAFKYTKWIKMLGFRPIDLKQPRQRCMFNILSAGWAAKHFKDEIRWSLRGRVDMDPDAPMAEGATDTRIMLRNVKAQPADKWLCDSCSLQLDCKFFREGAVCAVPDSEPMELSHFFKTRDSQTIIEGLGTLLATQSHRVNRALHVENKGYEDDERDGQIDPELTKIINSLFDRGLKLAKLVDPSLRAGPKVAVNSNNTAVINSASPAALMAAVVEELTKRGVRREDITPEMVTSILTTPDDTRHRAIEAAVVATADDDAWDDDDDDD